MPFFCKKHFDLKTLSPQFYPFSLSAKTGRYQRLVQTRRKHGGSTSRKGTSTKTSRSWYGATKKWKTHQIFSWLYAQMSALQLLSHLLLRSSHPCSRTHLCSYPGRQMHQPRSQKLPQDFLVPFLFSVK